MIRLNKQDYCHSRPGFEKSSSGPVPGVSVAPGHCSKPKTSGFSGVGAVQPHRSSKVSKSQPCTQAVDSKQLGDTETLYGYLCVRMSVVEEVPESHS